MSTEDQKDQKDKPKELDSNIKSLFLEYVDKLEKSVLAVKQKFSARQLKDYARLQVCNKPIVDNITAYFLKTFVDEITEFINNQESFIRDKVLADNNSISIGTRFNIYNNPAIKLALNRLTLTHCKTLCLVSKLLPDRGKELLLPDGKISKNLEFFVPLIQYTPPKPEDRKLELCDIHVEKKDNELVVTHRQTIPSARSEVRFEACTSQRRALGISLPNEFKSEINSTIISIKGKEGAITQLALVMNDICQDLSRAIDQHIIEEKLTSTIKYNSINLSSELLENASIFVQDQDDWRFEVPKIQNSLNSLLCRNVAKYTKKHTPKDFIDLIKNSIANMDATPRFRHPDVLLLGKNLVSLLNQSLEANEAKLSTDEDAEKRYFGYMGSMMDIDVVATDLLPDNLGLLYQDYMTTYCLAQLFSLGKDDTTIAIHKADMIFEVHDQIAIPLPKNTKLEAINHPALLIHLDQNV